MLSNNYQSESAEQFNGSRNNTKSDIFFLQTEKATPKKVSMDRNRSTVFDKEPIELKQVNRPHRLNSDIFFCGNPELARFGNYVPSMAAPKRCTPKEIETQERASSATDRPASTRRDVQEQPLTSPNSFHRNITDETLGVQMPAGMLFYYYIQY
jgi:hypothetical protein